MVSVCNCESIASRLTLEVLLLEPWDSITQRDVPDLFVADFGIASHVQTIGTRVTAQRGTPGYEAPVWIFTLIVLRVEP
jgi:hypothetical protein